MGTARKAVFPEGRPRREAHGGQCDGGIALYETEEKQERALLVCLDTGEYDAESSLAELSELVKSAGADPAFTLAQKRPAPDTATCVGSGMAQEVAELCRKEELDLVIFDRDSLPPRSGTWKSCAASG